MILLLAGGLLFSGEGDDAPKTPPVEVKDPVPAIAGQAPAFPLKSDRWAQIIDSYDEQEDAQLVEQWALDLCLSTVRATTQEKLVEVAEGTVTFNQLMKRPEDYRGHVVFLSGMFRHIVEKKLGFSESGVSSVWLGQVSTSRGEIVNFISLDPIPADLKYGTGVRVAGIFVKRYAYLNDEPGDHLTWGPLVFIRRLDPFSDLSATKSGTWFGFEPFEVLVSLFALVGLTMLIFYRSRVLRQPNVFTRMRERHKEAAAELARSKPAKPRTIKVAAGEPPKDSPSGEGQTGSGSAASAPVTPTASEERQET